MAANRERKEKKSFLCISIISLKESRLWAKFSWDVHIFQLVKNKIERKEKSVGRDSVKYFDDFFFSLKHVLWDRL